MEKEAPQYTVRKLIIHCTPQWSKLSKTKREAKFHGVNVPGCATQGILFYFYIGNVINPTLVT